MRKRKISRDVLVLAILSLITVLTWIIFDVYRIFSRKEGVDVPASQLQPLNPSLDQAVIEQISQESYLEKGEYLSPKEATQGAEQP